uniref:Pyrroline-5-carboxylate reductase catalytic N-terminal domain-containing protein n=1 Tax=Brassica oleracea TaxID=3712 RepID=A0A3P6CHI0_BRAOL|nr:unnamed protein product [Brassica oleracea]
METLPISVESFKVGFIGAGKMVESISRGVVASGMRPPNRNWLYSNLNRRQVFESFGVNVFSSSEEVVKETNVVIFSVKPQVGMLSTSQIYLKIYLFTERSPFYLMLGMVWSRLVRKGDA